MDNNKETGGYGEQLAAEFITNLGYEIILKNYVYGKGEVDIIANDNEILVFIEVKYRKNLEYGRPELQITKSKQHQIKRVALGYLFEHDIRDTQCRFDVIAILHLPETDPEINHIINAF
jgi:putative endonuclease